MKLKYQSQKWSLIMHFISVTQTIETPVGKENMERDKLATICKELDKNNTAATDQQHRVT